jgi:uncharacterized membrane protein
VASPASVAKHPIHPMVVVFPIGLWIFSFIMDLIYFFGNGTGIWNTVALYTMIGGIVGALLAAVPGFIDFLSLSGKRRRTATIHMGINLGLVVLFVVDAVLRFTGTPVVPGPIVLSLIGVIFLGVSGWLGGELVYVQGTAVEPAGTCPEVPMRRTPAERYKEQRVTA